MQGTNRQLRLARRPDGMIDDHTFVVVMTHNFLRDKEYLGSLVGTPAAYIGMIGSKRRTSAVLEHLQADGVPSDTLARVHTPIGLDIGAETPEEIAISIIAEIIMVRRGGNGQPMYYRRGQAKAAGTPSLFPVP